MTCKVKLKNSEDVAILDQVVYDFLTTDPYLVEIDFINNIRKHSSGCVVFQKIWKNPDGSYIIETIYLHKLIAEKFLSHKKTPMENLVGAKNENKLDCRLENLFYRSRAQASRQRRATSNTGYTGVYKEGERYRAVISNNGKSIHIGMFSSAEEAAVAFNAMSKKLFGDKGKINKVNWNKGSSKSGN